MLKKLFNSQHYLSLEVTPSHGASLEIILEKITNSKLHEKVSSFIVTDSPLARLKSNSIITASVLQKHFKKPVIATMAMRDRNKIALQSDLLGANELDIRYILALTGDSANASNQPNVKGVFESNSTLLLDIIRCFNSGIDYSGAPFKYPPKEICPLAVCNSYAKNPKVLIKKIGQKIKFGARAIITQPVFSLQNAKELKQIFESAQDELKNIKHESTIIFGFFPVTKLRTAQFLNSHVPGVHIPQEWISKLTIAKNISEEEELKAGLFLSRNAFKEIFEFHPKIHLMSANNFSLISQIIE